MTHFKKLRKASRDEAINSGLLRRVAEETGFTVATVSRTFAGKFTRRPNPDIIAALARGLKALGIDSERAA